MDGSKDVSDKLAMFRSFVNDRGMSEEEAAKRILDLDDPTKKPARGVLKPDADKFVKDLTLSQVTDAFDPGLFHFEPGAGLMPSQQNALLGEYRDLAEQRFYETGDTSAAKAHQILRLAEAHDLVIVENDALADLKPRSMARIATLDQLRRTIYIGSFSKSVSASLRVGFLACDEELASDLADVKMLTHVSSSEYCERTLEVILSEGHFLRHTNRMQDKLRRATASGIKALEEIGATIYRPTDQSLYLWARLPEHEDSIALARRMLDHGVILAPGAVFSPRGDGPSPWFRFNVAYLNDPRFAAALRAIESA